MKIIAIIPARGGSKRIPLKNLIMLGDKPLLAYPIMLSKSIDIIDRVIVSSDHKEIIDKALEFGAEAPFVRPAEISDNLPCEFVTEHAIRFLIEQENYTPDIVITLTPATPFTQKEELKKAIDLLCDHDDWDSVISVRKANEFPEWLVKYKPGEPVTTYLGNPLDGKYNVSQNLIR